MPHSFPTIKQKKTVYEFDHLWLLRLWSGTARRARSAPLVRRGHATGARRLRSCRAPTCAEPIVYDEKYFCLQVNWNRIGFAFDLLLVIILIDLQSRRN